MSSFCKFYGETKKTVDREKYWDKKGINKEMKEEWSRILSFMRLMNTQSVVNGAGIKEIWRIRRTGGEGLTGDTMRQTFTSIFNVFWKNAENRKILSALNEKNEPLRPKARKDVFSRRSSGRIKIMQPKKKRRNLVFN